MKAIIVALFLAASTLTAQAGLKEEVFSPSVQIGDYCSGTVVHSERDRESGEVETVVLTAKHCVKSGERVTVDVTEYDDSLRETKRVQYAAKVLGSSWKSDLAVIKLSDKSTIFPSAKIAPKDIELSFGEEVHTASYPAGFGLTYTRGHLGYIQHIGRYSNSGEYLRATPDVVGGSSGSGLFVLRPEGYVLTGTLTAGYNLGTFMNLYTPIDEIREYWDVAKKVLKTEAQ